MDIDAAGSDMAAPVRSTSEVFLRARVEPLGAESDTPFTRHKAFFYVRHATALHHCMRNTSRLHCAASVQPRVVLRLCAS